jgi:hypothetical protein
MLTPAQARTGKKFLLLLLFLLAVLLELTNQWAGPGQLAAGPVSQSVSTTDRQAIELKYLGGLRGPDGLYRELKAAETAAAP